MTGYILSTVTLSLACLVLGFWLGQAYRTLQDVKEAVVDGVTPKNRRHPFGSELLAKSVGVILVLLAVMSVIVSLITGTKAREKAACQAKYNAAVVTNLQIRTEITNQDRAALDQLVTDILLAKSRQDSTDALKRYRDARQEADAERARNPFPAFPQC